MSYQADTLGRNIRHALQGDSKKLWDDVSREYRRLTGRDNTIGMIEALCAIALAEMSTWLAPGEPHTVGHCRCGGFHLVVAEPDVPAPAAAGPNGAASE